MLKDAEVRLITALERAGSEHEFWHEVARSGTPIIDDHGGDSVELTLLWRMSDGTEVDHVYVEAGSLTDHHLPELDRMVRLGDTSIWFWSTEAERTWRGSYCFMPVSDAVAREFDFPGAADDLDGMRKRWMGLRRFAVGDDFATDQMDGGGVASMPGAPEQRFWRPVPESQPWTDRFDWASDLLGISRSAWLYETAHDGGSPEDRPLVVVLDGQNWIDEQPLGPALGRAVASGELPSCVLLFIDSIDADTRGRELPCNDTFWTAVIDELIPRARAKASFTENPERTVVSGQSYGGLAALYAGLTHPERFGLVASQSGSYWWPTVMFDGGGGTPGGYIAELIAGQKISGFRAVLDVGNGEGEMELHNRVVHAALTEQGIDCTLDVFDGGHDPACWRGTLVESVIALLGPRATSSRRHDR